MAIFLNYPKRNPAPPTRPVQRLCSFDKLPAWMRRLDVRCHGRAHAPMVARMGFVAWGRTPAGASIARYVCPICGSVEAWGLDHPNAGPRRISRSGTGRH